MDRFFVPRLGFVVVIGLATLLIGVIVLRSPDTHSNLWTSLRPDYARTAVATVGGESLHAGPSDKVAFVLPEMSSGQNGGEPMNPGRKLYLSAGCANCHGLDARGAPVGPSLAGSADKTVEKMVRDGPGGMPAYTKEDLNEVDLSSLVEYLQSIQVVKPSPAEITGIQSLKWDPAISASVLLQGKASLRRSCGGCHTQPTKDEILSAFASDFDAASLVADMVRRANLSVQDARPIAYYMMAILNGADPLKEP